MLTQGPCIRVKRFDRWWVRVEWEEIYTKDF